MSRLSSGMPGARSSGNDDAATSYVPAAPAAASSLSSFFFTPAARTVSFAQTPGVPGDSIRAIFRSDPGEERESSLATNRRLKDVLRSLDGVSPSPPPPPSTSSLFKSIATLPPGASSGTSHPPGHAAAMAAAAAMTELEAERAAQEERSAKVLALLRSKDAAIQQLESRAGAAEAEAGTTRERLEESRERVEDLIASGAAHQRRAAAAEAAAAEAAAEMARLRKAVEAGDAAAMQANRLAEELEASREHIEALQQSLEAADGALEEARQGGTARDATVRELEEENAVLRGCVTRLLSMEEKDVRWDALRRAPNGGGTGTGTDEAQNATIRQLEAVNEALEAALVCANLKLAGIDPSSLPEATPEALAAELDTSADGNLWDTAAAANAANALSMASARLTAVLGREEAVRLSSELAEMTAALAEARQRAQHHEAAHSVAHAAAMDAEKMLKEVLQREEALKARLEEAEGEASGRAAAEGEARAARERADSAAEKERSATKRCADFEVSAAEAEAMAAEANESAAAARAEAAAAVADARRQANDASRSAERMRKAMMDAQAENDELKQTVAALESRLAAPGIGEAAREAAESLVSRVARLNAVTSSAEPTPLEELARGLGEAAADRAALHRRLAAAEAAAAAKGREVHALRGSIARLRAAMLADEGAGTDAAIDITPIAAALPPNAGAESEALADLRDKLLRSLAAQEGQAAAFAALAEDAAGREAAFDARLRAAESACAEVRRLEGLCSTSVAAMQAALAQVALAEGWAATGTAAADSEDLLSADVAPDDLPHLAAKAATKLQDFAAMLYQSNAAAVAGDAAMLAAAQRDVIASLSSQLAAAGPLPSAPVVAETARVGQRSLNGSGSGSSPSRRLLGLCALLSHQVGEFETLSGALGGNSAPALDKVAQSLKSTLCVLQDEMLTCNGNAAGESNTPGLKAHETITIDAAGTRIAAQPSAAAAERISLLTAANDAAQIEIDHAREAMEELARTLHATIARADAAAAAATGREEALRNELAGARDEADRLGAALREIENEREGWEARFTAKLAALQARLDVETSGGGGSDTAAASTGVPQGLIPLLNGLDGLLNDAVAMEERLKRFEAAAEEADRLRSVVAAQRWNALTARLQRARAVAETWYEARGK